jgi:hypothetical protein
LRDIIDFNNYITARNGPSANVVTLFTPNQVVDSGNKTGLRASIGNSSLQLLQCSKTLVTQRGQILKTSKDNIPAVLSPGLHKTQSNWGTLTNGTDDSTLIGGNQVSHLITPTSEIHFYTVGTNFVRSAKLEHSVLVR